MVLTETSDQRAADVPVGRAASARGWLEAAVALLAGAVLAGGGAGLAVRHLQKTGLSLVTVGGVVLLTVGSATLAWSLRRMWHLSSRQRHRRWTRTFTLLGSFLVLVALGSSTALAAAYAVAPRTSLGRAVPVQFGFAARDVTFVTADHVELSAWWSPGRNRAALVLLHGAGSSRSATLPQAAVLSRHGFGVLLVDARGHGRSRGRGMDLGWYGDRDVSAAVSFLSGQPEVDPTRIGLVGLSMGGEEAIGAAAADPRVRTVVAEGATARTSADKAEWLPGGVSGVLQRGLEAVTFGLTALLTKAPTPEPLVRSIDRARVAMLVISAGTMPDEARAATAFQAAGPTRVSTWTVPGAAHTGGLARAPAAWEAHVVGFLSAAMEVQDDAARRPIG